MTTQEVEQQVATEQRAERIVLAALSNERLMSQVRRSMALERDGVLPKKRTL